MTALYILSVCNQIIELVGIVISVRYICTKIRKFNDTFNRF